MTRVPNLSIPVAMELLTPAARAMVALMPNTDLARLDSISREKGQVMFTVRGCSTPRPVVKLISTISDGDRCRKFGVSGRRFADREALESYIERRERVYGSAMPNWYMWTLPTDGLSAVTVRGEGAAWLNRMAENLAKFCETGFYELGEKRLTDWN